MRPFAPASAAVPAACSSASRSSAASSSRASAPTSRRARRSSWTGLAAAGLLALVFAGGCGSDARSGEPEPAAPAALPVEVATVATGAASAYYSGTASLEAEQEATVVARVGGVVEAVLVEAGDVVRAGQPLARLDDERLRLELERAEVTLRKLERAFERSRAVYDKQLISAESFEQTRSDYEAQKVARDLARLEVEHATVRAPIAGVVSDRAVKVGNMVRANDPTFELTGIDPLWAVMHMPERELNKLRAGQTALLRLDALPERSFEGTVKLISPVVDPETGTFRVVVEVRNRDRAAKPGMFGRVRVEYDTRPEARLIPKAALVEEDSETFAFVVEDTLALRRTVTTGYASGDRIEVVDGLADGDRVVVSGQATLRDSAHVEVVQ